MSVIVGYTTESGNSAGKFGLFDDEVKHKLGGVHGTALDRLRDAKSVGHAFEIRQAINREPKRGTAGEIARRAFDHAWHEPRQ